MNKEISLVFTFFKYNIKALKNYQKDFFVGIFVVFVNIFVNIFFIEVLFNNINTLGGWTEEELIFLYGIGTFNVGFYKLLYGNLRSLKRYIFDGKLEIMLSKPVEPILFLRIRDFDIQPILSIFSSVLIFLYVSNRIILNINIGKILVGLFLSALSVSFLSSLALVCLSSLFYTNYLYTPYDSFANLFKLGKYPFDIFPKIIFKSFISIFPLGLISFIPSSFILEKSKLGWEFPIVVIAVLILHLVSRKYFYRALRNYDGLGN